MSTPDVSIEVSDEFRQRVRRLVNYVSRTHKAGRGVILFAVWQSIFIRRMAESSLEDLLEDKGFSVKKVNLETMPAEELVFHLFEAAQSPKDVLFIYNLEQTGQDGLHALNYRREAFCGASAAGRFLAARA